VSVLRRKKASVRWPRLVYTVSRAQCTKCNTRYFLMIVTQKFNELEAKVNCQFIIFTLKL